MPIVGSGMAVGFEGGSHLSAFGLVKGLCNRHLDADRPFHHICGCSPGFRCSSTSGCGIRVLDTSSTMNGPPG
jgi:hypothetical protein